MVWALVASLILIFSTSFPLGCMPIFQCFDNGIAFSFGLPMVANRLVLRIRVYHTEMLIIIGNIGGQTGLC